MADGTMTSPRTPPGDAARTDADRLVADWCDLHGGSGPDVDPDFDHLADAIAHALAGRDATIADLRARLKEADIDANAAAVVTELAADMAEQDGRTIADLRAQVAAKDAEIERLRAVLQRVHTVMFFDLKHMVVNTRNGRFNQAVSDVAHAVHDALAASPPAAQPDPLIYGSDEHVALRRDIGSDTEHLERDAQPTEAPQPGDVARARQLLTDELRGFGRKIGGMDVVATAVAGEFSRIRAAERSRILAMLRDLHEHRLRDVATVLARRHYAGRFCKTEGDPHVEMNAQANWMIFAPQVLSVAVLLADAIEATPDAR